MIRFTNARRLFYIVQGCHIITLRKNWKELNTCMAGTFAETSSPEHQLHWIIENCKVVRAANGISIAMEAIKLANSKHDLLRYVQIQEDHSNGVYLVVAVR